MGLKWSTSALVGVAAGAGAALARARRPRYAVMPPRVSVGVDGLGEFPADDVEPGAPLTRPAPELTAPPEVAGRGGDAASAEAGDAIRALDEARLRLRRRADELAREMGANDG